MATANNWPNPTSFSAVEFSVSNAALTRAHNAIIAMTYQGGTAGVAVFLFEDKIRVLHLDHEDAKFYTQYSPEILVGLYDYKVTRAQLLEDIEATAASLMKTHTKRESIDVLA